MGSERAAKEKEVEMLTGSFAAADLVMCADYRGLTVSEITELRNQLRKVGAVSRVVKNTLAKISAGAAYDGGESGELEKFIDLFCGPSFLVFANDDLVAPAKVVSDFKKENEVFEIKGGWFEGKFINEDGVIAVSKLPSREETLQKLLGLINAPATQLARVIQAPGQQVVQVLGAHSRNIAA